MKNFIRAEIHHDGEFYCGMCLDFDVFSQGNTIDELIVNLKEAIQLHLEDDKDQASEFIPAPSLITMMDLGEVHV